MLNHENERLPPRRTKLRTATMVAMLLLVLSIPAIAFVGTAGASVPLNTVEVAIQTTRNLPFQYTLTAYNTSGFQVANFVGIFPQVAFGLPGGTYLITASAYYQQNYFCNPCPVGKGVANGTNPLPTPYILPYSEYGYAVVKVSGPSQITIATQNSTETSMVNLPAHVAFYNGTAASGAYVSAYLVGFNFPYSQAWVTYGQTGSDGNFTLVLPNAPVQVTASLSIPINLPKNVSAVTVEVGGQKVNVTVYWQPNSVNLAGQALILPPQKGAEITLQVQQFYPYPVYYAGGGTTTVTTVLSTTTAAPAQGSSPRSNAIAPFNPSKAQLTSPGQQVSGAVSGLGTVEMLVIGAAAATLVGVGLVLALARRKQTQNARP